MQGLATSWISARGLMCALLLAPVVALAQQPELMQRIGVLVGLAENDPEMKERLSGI